MGPEALQKKLEDESEGLKKIQKDLSKTDSRRSHLDSQLNENKMVKAEMDVLEENDVVYKLIGPALIRQDLTEAKCSVDKRIEYISNEITRHDSALEKLTTEQDSKRDSLVKLQQQLQQLLVKAAAKN
uniref:Probable prefoldin subunit 6 n=1 Tax=Hirondellea gigas TaxID=1518452 RepID=A0A2P2I101_9CRUS